MHPPETSEYLSERHQELQRADAITVAVSYNSFECGDSISNHVDNDIDLASYWNKMSINCMMCMNNSSHCMCHLCLQSNSYSVKETVVGVALGYCWTHMRQDYSIPLANCYRSIQDLRAQKRCRELTVFGQQYNTSRRWVRQPWYVFMYVVC